MKQLNQQIKVFVHLDLLNLIKSSKTKSKVISNKHLTWKCMQICITSVILHWILVSLLQIIAHSHLLLSLKGQKISVLISELVCLKLYAYTVCMHSSSIFSNHSVTDLREDLGS